MAKQLLERLIQIFSVGSGAGAVLPYPVSGPGVIRAGVIDGKSEKPRVAGDSGSGLVGLHLKDTFPGVVY